MPTLSEIPWPGLSHLQRKNLIHQVKVNRGRVRRFARKQLARLEFRGDSPDEAKALRTWLAR
jgi:hypothetical protein